MAGGPRNVKLVGAPIGRHEDVVGRVLSDDSFLNDLQVSGQRGPFVTGEGRHFSLRISELEFLHACVKTDFFSRSELILKWLVIAPVGFPRLGRVLAGEQTLVLDSIVKDNSARYLQRENEKYLKTRDSLLRAKVNKEEAYGVSSGVQRHLPIEGVHFFTPLKGVISNGYDMASHPAVDITAPKNSVIKSVLDGSVVAAGWSDEYGYTITIQHEGDILSTYKHNSKLLKKQGDKVSAGTPIAQVGNTGSLTTGAHLHFELWYKGEAIDPTKYISF